MTGLSETAASVLLVDDHVVVREGLRELLSRERGLQVVGEAKSVVEALSACERLSPALAIVDLTLGDESGLEFIRLLRKTHPLLRILVLSMHDERLYAQRALQAGADGYVGKYEPSEVLVAAVRRVLSGKTYVSERVSEQLLASVVGRARDDSPPAGLSLLSDRQLEVLRLVGVGRNTQEIATAMGISAKTVETHRSRIKEKLGLSTASELVMFAVNWVRDESAS